MKTKTYPEIGFLRLRDVIGDRDNPGIIPVSRSSRCKGIAEGRYPKPVKLGERMSAWRIDSGSLLTTDIAAPVRLSKNSKKRTLRNLRWAAETDP